MKQFTDLGLAEPILRAVSAEGYTTPTPIQMDVIPTMLAGHDIIGIAQTGTGKTASFVLPLLHKITESRQSPGPKSCGALVLAPTRELAAQIADAIKAYGQFMRHSVTVVVGGAKPAPQIRAMSGGVDILVATPGRLEDHMSAGVIRLDKTTTVVLDEADQMLDLGFMPAIRRVMGKLPKSRQTVLMSATMPKQIRSLAHDFLKDPIEIAVAQVSKPIDRIDQTLMRVNKADKRQILIDILKREKIDRAIVFTRTKHGANKVVQNLEKAGLTASAIHGNKSQGQRQATLAGFRNGAIKILVATDIAARGIDVDGVSHVINYELPNVPEVYVHRIGRTARAGNSGIAIALCDETEHEQLRDIERLIGHAFGEDGKLGEAIVGNHRPEDSANAGGAPKKKRNRNRNKNRDAAPGTSGAPKPAHNGAGRRSHSGGKPANGPANAGSGRPQRSGQRSGPRPAQGSGNAAATARPRRQAKSFA